MELAKKNVLILAIAQGLSVTTTNIGIINTGLVGFLLSPEKEYATLPLSLQFLTLALLLIPVSLLMGKYGRKIIFILGVISSLIGTLIVAYSIFEKNFLFFILGSILIGISQATQQFYRYAAADNVPDNFKSKALSYVISGGLIAAILGPELSKISYNFLTEYLYLATYLIAGLIQILNLFVLLFLKIPKQEKVINTRRPLSEILFKKNLILAVFSAALGYALMSFIMTATPIQIVNICKLGNEINANVIQWHVIAMFAPSLFTGQLINRFGNLNLMTFGLIFYLLSIFFGTIGQTEYHFWLSLFCCGLGWNFLFVGGSDVIAKSSNPKEKPIVQGVTDFIIFGSVALSSFLGGNLLASIGWHMMLYLSLIPISLLSFYIIFLWFSKLNEAKIKI